MRDAPDMPELQEEHAALGMNGVDDLAPSLDLLFRPDAGYVGIGDDQSARRGALGVVFHVQRPRREARLFRPHARQGRHHDAVLQVIRTDLQR
jgi:hypothetical protein